ncbi:MULTISPECIES: 3-hydroxybutyrate dehydrogenase [unclassified Kaistella]|uniref:3-hydroxybutyrate dehydrogenase n=1 Tax=unclassified Kaistella TaxID=2762626 RepID=UPI002735E000|nr:MULTISPECIES: 3-hydroxybutyrate dehydrogenase [unclassified Kaistella]MDP2454741.1 3-hydroxybutyrate dehydrogenase [Kaistella sp. SH11-4b]MDP2457478.1 3-hydroxybutyrate dehydrogenase [Kaistella sp. SH40-3]MDP2460238.1 3-hydroxybutyrate dehydrogenase [Kaistella sp. SH19-2b]
MSRNVLITGSTSGIGLGIAEAFAKNGDNIVFNGLETNGAEISKSMGEKYGVKTVFKNSNLMTPEGVQELVDFAYSEMGSIDVLVNNAGIQHVSPIKDFPIEKYQQIIALNMNSVFYASKAVFKKMKGQNFGRIINVASVHGIRASEFKSAYVTAKHGVVGLTKVLALEGAPFNVTCNAICPGYVKTPLVEGQIKDLAKAHNMTEDEVVEKVMLQKQAVKSFVPIEKLGEIAVFLAAENATTVSGTTFTLDGAWSAQ